MFGYAGRILDVDLSSGRHWVEDLEEDLARKHLESRGLGAYPSREKLVSLGLTQTAATLHRGPRS